MQQFFEKFVSRRITIRKAEHEDLEEYMSQVRIYQLKKDKDKIIINEQPDRLYLAIEDSAAKLIGLIKVEAIEKDIPYVSISIPNNVWNARYGKETLHQFVKCCKQRKLYKRICFNYNNKIVREYKEERPEMFDKGVFVDLSIA